MTLYPAIQNSFTGGEMTPRLLGRSDLEKYYSSCRTLVNFIPMAHGGAIFRSGTYYIGPTKNENKVAVLIPFNFSDEQTYVLEFGHQYMRIFRDQGQLANGGTITEIATPWTSDQVRQLKVAQQADVMFIAHPDVAPRVLKRLAGDDSLPATWDLSAFDYEWGPYLDINATDLTLTPSAATGTGITITASDDLFESTDVDRLIRLSNSGSGVEIWGEAKITAYVSATQVTADVIVNFATLAATTDWRLGAWSNTTGWPWCVAIFQERLYWGGTNANPMIIVGSQFANYYRYQQSKFSDGSVRDHDAFVRFLYDNEVNGIVNIRPKRKGMVLFTTAGEWTGSAQSEYEAITPGNFYVEKHTGYATAVDMPVTLAGSELLFWQNGGRRLRELRYSFQDDGLVARNLSLRSEHITAKGAIDAAYQEEADQVLWAVRDDGVLVGFTYERAEDVTAWHRHLLGGSSPTRNHAEVESVACIREGTNDILYLIVKRKINGQERRYVEWMNPLFTPNSEQEDAFHVDCGISYDGAPEDEFSGLDHLEGETVSVLADGAVHPDCAVVDGAITLDDEYSVVHVGLPYTGELEPMPFVLQGRGGISSHGQKLRVAEVKVYFHNTLGGRVGSIPVNDDDDEGEWEELQYHKAGDSMDTAPSLFTGYKIVSIPQSTDELVTVFVKQDTPLPMTVLSMTAEIVVDDS